MCIRACRTNCVKTDREYERYMKDNESEDRVLCERDNFVSNSLIHFEPVKRFKNRRKCDEIKK
jgi:hypothetical protein